MLKEECKSMGMVLDKWTHKSCTCMIGYGLDWATIYSIESTNKRKGHAEELILYAKNYYEQIGMTFATSIALSESMRCLVKKLNLLEYK